VALADDEAGAMRDLERRFPRARVVSGDADVEHLLAKMVASSDDPRAAVELPLDLHGTTFQRRVWAALREIPAGRTTSYAELATRVGLGRTGARAVAQAVAANPIAIAIPCHRVVGSDGRLSGYRWGVQRKRELLAREGPMQLGLHPAQPA
jgi:AraC family transcriptional regulator, regulatory protein of adaptative response / methylated-DNA-[protein]-cysteine methyltransferase